MSTEKTMVIASLEATGGDRSRRNGRARPRVRYCCCWYTYFASQPNPTGPIANPFLSFSTHHRGCTTSNRRVRLSLALLYRANRASPCHLNRYEPRRC